jgi:hypothetical protein
MAFEIEGIRAVQPRQFGLGSQVWLAESFHTGASLRFAVSRCPDREQGIGRAEANVEQLQFLL